MQDGRSLWIRTTGPAWLLERIEPRIEPFLGPAVLVAAQEGRDLRVVPPIDVLTERRLGAVLLPAIETLTGSAVRVERSAGPPPRRPAPSSLVALMFSGGVDSLHALRVLIRDGATPDLLVSVNAGGAGRDRRCWYRRLEGAVSVAAELGVPLATIDTNLHELAATAHPVAHTFRNLGAARVLRDVVGTLAYSAGHRLEVTSFPDAIAYPGDLVEPVTLDAMRPEGMELLLVGSDISKAHKLATLAPWPLAHRSLDICVNGAYQAGRDPDAPVNCGRCHKCARTILVLQHLGLLDPFAARFDLVAFQDVRERTLDTIETRPFHLENEARALLAGPPGTLPALVPGVLPPGPGEDTTPEPIGHAALRVPRRGAPVILSTVTLDGADGEVRLACPVGDGRGFRMVVTGPAAILAELEPRIEPFLPSVLVLGMAEGRPVRIMGGLDADHVRRLRTRTLPLVRGLLAPADLRLTVCADASAPLGPPPPPMHRVARLVMAEAELRALAQPTPDDIRPDLLVIVDTGGHGPDSVGWPRWQAHVREVATSMGLPLVTIATNLHDLARAPHELLHPMAELSAATVLRPVAGVIEVAGRHPLRATSFRDARREGRSLLEPLVPEAVRWGGLQLLWRPPRSRREVAEG
jgi:hypothetical protein